MRILGFDTATRATAVALLDTEAGVAIERRDDPPPSVRPRHTTRLMGLIAEVLSAGGAGWEAIDLIAVGIGPGTFTGLRIGVATARALSQARGIGLVGVSTLESLAGAASEATGEEEAIVAVLDARRGEVFAAGWSAQTATHPDREPTMNARAGAPEAIADTAQRLGLRWLAVGDGAVEFRPVLERSGARIPEDDSSLHRVTAVTHCRLASSRRPGSPDGVQPEYLRLPDAELNLRASQKL
ncbi:MAG: tRNA (adenosine(37)-N6)-threonylcarbamoyltransferase complex dimerization subunit type 1 TsaB [Solirubrobacteraceae bacterium]